MQRLSSRRRRHRPPPRRSRQAVPGANQADYSDPASKEGNTVDQPILLATIAFVGAVILVLLYLSVRVVQQYEQMVVFRLGRTSELMVRGPGLRFLVPIVDRP